MKAGLGLTAERRIFPFGLISVVASAGLLTGLFLPFLSSPEGDALCQSLSCPLTARLAGSAEGGTAVALLVGFVAGLVGYLVSSRLRWVVLALLASAGAVILGMVSALATPGGVLPNVTSAPVGVDVGFWVFVAAGALGLLSAVGMSGQVTRRGQRRTT